ncbi:unnamed protein product [Allacma fusca]|uniref:G-protein coupled receptors family 1 profile domain-containing protein n=1 Tax=Allacma fusca TaxID=39272 RepID=A0A8J2PBC7_9HEXA|nr:unnamed protein product [Allacma fusca]
MSSSEEMRFVSPAGTPDYTEVDESVQEVDRGDPFYVSELSLNGDKFVEIFSSNYTSSAFPPSFFNFAVNCVSSSGSGVTSADIVAGCPLAASSLLPPLSSTMEELAEGGVEGSAGPGSYSSISAWILVLIMTFLIVVTIVGNVLVCLSVILVRKLRKPQNYLLVSLATSDLFVALFVMPFAIIVEFHEGQWPLNPALCDLWVSGQSLLL